MDNYAVVVFKKENAVDVVSASWIVKDDEVSTYILKLT